MHNTTSNYYISERTPYLEVVRLHVPGKVRDVEHAGRGGAAALRRLLGRARVESGDVFKHAGLLRKGSRKCHHGTPAPIAPYPYCSTRRSGNVGGAGAVVNHGSFRPKAARDHQKSKKSNNVHLSHFAGDNQQALLRILGLDSNYISCAEWVGVWYDTRDADASEKPSARRNIKRYQLSTLPPTYM